MLSKISSRQFSKKVCQDKSRIGEQQTSLRKWGLENYSLGYLTNWVADNNNDCPSLDAALLEHKYANSHLTSRWPIQFFQHLRFICDTLGQNPLLAPLEFSTWLQPMPNLWPCMHAGLLKIYCFARCYLRFERIHLFGQPFGTQPRTLFLYALGNADYSVIQT